MKTMLARTVLALRYVVSGRRRLGRYRHADAHRGSHPDRYTGLDRHYVPTPHHFPGAGGV
ncbi:hypothetical protein ACLGIH_02135 [Streptomyces sp. HMX87]|uniref:hypothetical protein n=1 Tax=Streptomyces sp. HMX87 TaxID=3390849 RepID=UPI003A86ABCA